MRKYLIIYTHFFKFMLMYVLQYRLNAVALSVYFPSWQLVGLGVIWLIYEQAPIIGGWNRAETLVLYYVVQIMFCITYFIFIDGGVRHMMWNSVRTGEFDFALTKPLNVQFLSILARPSIAPVLSMTVLLPFFVAHLWNSQLVSSWTHILAFLVVSVMSLLVLYFIISAYATLAFYSAQSYQAIETLIKATEFGSYPLTIFPFSIQIILSTILPNIFFGYAAVLFLLGRGSLQFFLILVVAVFVSAGINRFAWREGLKHYSSASS